MPSTYIPALADKNEPQASCVDNRKCIKAVFPEQGRCELVPLTLPEELGAKQVLVQTEISLISQGTETTVYTGRHSNLKKDAEWPRFPFRPGYSLVGRVLEIGSEVRETKVGDRVFVAAAHASHVVAPEVDLVRLPAGISPESGTFTELGAIALNGVRMARVGLADSVIVAGLGLVGLLATRLLKLSGAMPLMASDPCATRREIGLKLGADHVFDPSSETVLASLRCATGGVLADVVIEATGIPRVVTECLPWARSEGKVILLGSPHGRTEVDFFTDVHKRNLHLIGAHIDASVAPSINAVPWSKARNRAAFLEFVRRGDITLDPLITHRIAPTELAATYKLLAEAPGTFAGVIVNWSQAE